MIDTTPDSAPIIEKIEKIPGLVVASGMSGHGLSMAPAAAQLVAELVSNETTRFVDPNLYLGSRF
ncbi:FAD-dependent oxidoreductase (plasmid) [Rhizobium sp. 32-5/1]|uniref:FAD-dependent oxidoreductase n=1 Tax=Rhizobium sp. 32-5/1 TaxID=3019602 RepID=UPI00240D6F04|nr:FAD-dependent oxidoreductase [Rhizobium sp. 32-5/1]WEZ85352.1 FAD-dependent oxidoreductase [Rhizobium sp. 32-5/1]